MNYYLPTTVKLLNSYETLSRQSVKGENIRSAMFDIEGMMETIATAFEKQLDFLFGTQVLDLQADMTVMESILEQEGLKDSDTTPKLKL
jgi:5-bromo-4-chloroindolyl phosphate hydrolysis protein